MTTMKLTVIFLLATTATCLTAWQLDSDCGIKGPSNFERIVGGVEAAPHEFPWFAAMDGCGASVINKDWLITAGHCVFGGYVKLTFFFGMNSLSSPDVLTRVSQKTVLHPNYTEINAPNNDIALVKLSESLPLGNASAHLGTICLPEPETDFDELAGNSSLVCGFGETKDPNISQKFLRKVNVTIWDNQACTEAYDTIPNDAGILAIGYINYTMICAATYGKDSCTGDSGGPMMTFNQKTGRWQLTGIVSWGDDCAIPYHPGVYTRVAEFLPWIKDTLQKY